MNSFGKIFKLSIFGESHGKFVGITIDGCPSGVELCNGDFTKDLLRRKSGRVGTTTRKEPDIPEIISGVYKNYTTGTPITIIFKNSDTKSSDYNFRNTPRPGHADFTGNKKYFSYNDDRGGGHFSGRLTVGLVAAGVIAKKIVSFVKISAKLVEAGGNNNIEEALNKAIKNNNSIGGIISCQAMGIPVGWGEPFFDSMESLISHIIFAIPGIKAIEFGNGFAAASLNGSENNDVFIDDKGKTKSNNSGGISGGISNGNNLFFKVAVKPTSSISIKQRTFDFAQNKITDLEIKGRHDVCIAIRAVPVVEAALAIVLADLFLQRKTQIV